MAALIAAVLVVGVGTLVVDPFDDDGDDVAVSSPSTTSTSSTSTSRSTTSTSRVTTSSSRAAAAATTTAAPTSSTSSTSTTTSAAPATSAPTTPTTTTLVQPAPTAEGSDLPRGQGGPAPITDDLAVTGTGSAVGTALGLLVLVLGAIALEVGRRLLRT